MVNWLDARSIVEHFGALIVIVTFVAITLETSTIIGGFLPGDSLLFTVGLTLASKSNYWNFSLDVLLILFGAVLGSQIGFQIGRIVGPAFFGKNRSRFLSERTVQRTYEYFERYGNRSLIFARFVPILRALVPTLAGIAGMEGRRFLSLNLIGGSAWVLTLMNAGYFLGVIPFVNAHIEAFVLAFAIVSSLPMPIELLREYLKRKREARQHDSDSATLDK